MKITPRMMTIKIESLEILEYALSMSLLCRKKSVFEIGFDIDDIPEFVKIVSPESKYEFSKNTLTFIPGPLEGGVHKFEVENIPDTFTHLIHLSPFLREDSQISLTGITNVSDESIDSFKITYYKIFRAFNIPLFEISINKRGFAPSGDGSILFKSKCTRSIDAINMKDKEPLLKIRGLVITSRIGGDYAHRMINKIKKEMSDLANTKVLCITNNRNDSGPSPGYECSVFGESKNGIFYSTVNNNDIPENMAEECCVKLLKSIDDEIIFDRKLLPVVVFFMGLSKGVSYLGIRHIDEKLEKILDLLKVFMKIDFTIEKYEDYSVISIIGSNYKNIFKPI